MAATAEVDKADDGGAVAAATNNTTGIVTDAGDGVPPTNSSTELPIRTNSVGGVPPPGHTLTGKQEHCTYSPKYPPTYTRVSQEY